jgi:hypothetical protein
MSGPEVCPTQEDYNRYKKQWNEERMRVKAVINKLENEKRKRSVSKKIICIRKLPRKTYMGQRDDLTGEWVSTLSCLKVSFLYNMLTIVFVYPCGCLCFIFLWNVAIFYLR